MNLAQMESSIRSFLVKELDAPCSSETHLNEVLFSVIEQLGDNDLDKIFEAEGDGFHAILEMATIVYKMQGKPLPAKYQRFFDKFDDWIDITIKNSPRELRAMEGGSKLLSSINKYKNFGIKIPNMLNKTSLEISGSSYERISRLAEQSNQSIASFVTEAVKSYIRELSNDKVVKILKSLDSSPLSFSDIVLKTGCNWMEIRDMLIELEHQNLLSIFIDENGIIRYMRI